VLADHHQPDRHRARLVDWKGDSAAIEKVDDGRSAQDQRVEPKIIFIDRKGGDRRCRDCHGDISKASKSAVQAVTRAIKWARTAESSMYSTAVMPPRSMRDLTRGS
jgi:hypothetical protein